MKFNTVCILMLLLAHGATARTVELIADRAFERGLSTTDRDGKRQVIVWNTNAAPPVWFTAQHHSKSCFADKAFQTITTNGISFKDDYQTLTIHPEDSEADFVCGVNGKNEFGGVWRAQGDPWPHLYLNQQISVSGGHLGTNAPSLADTGRIDFSANVRLLYDRKETGRVYVKQRHAAQYVCFFTIQNLNRQSTGFGDYYWFGITFYDDREPVTKLHAMLDKGSEKKKGTDKLIYNIGIKPFTDKIIADGEWVSIEGDILPHIIAGLQECWRRGYLPDSQDLSDYRLGSFVLGWEVTGLNDVAIAVKGLRAEAVIKPRHSELPNTSN